MKMTYAIAMAAAMDAANRQMRAAGRTAWSETDHDLACDVVNTLLGPAYIVSHEAS